MRVLQDLRELLLQKTPTVGLDGSSNIDHKCCHLAIEPRVGKRCKPRLIEIRERKLHGFLENPSRLSLGFLIKAVLGKNYLKLTLRYIQQF